MDHHHPLNQNNSGKKRRRSSSTAVIAQQLEEEQGATAAAASSSTSSSSSGMLAAPLAVAVASASHSVPTTTTTSTTGLNNNNYISTGMSMLVLTAADHSAISATTTAEQGSPSTAPAPVVVATQQQTTTTTGNDNSSDQQGGAGGGSTLVLLRRDEEKAKIAADTAQSVESTVNIAMSAVMKAPQQKIEDEMTMTHHSSSSSSEEIDPPLLLPSALQAIVTKVLEDFNTLSNKPHDTENYYASSEYPVFSAVQEFRSALTGLSAAFIGLYGAKEELDSANEEWDRAKEEEAQTRTTLSASSDHNNLRVQKLLETSVADKATSVADKATIVAKEATIVAKEATIVAKAASEASVVIEYFASLHNGSEATSQSQPSSTTNDATSYKRASSGEPKPELNAQRGTTLVASMLQRRKLLTFPKEVTEVGLPLQVGKFAQHLEELMLNACLVKKGEPQLKENIALTVAEILCFPVEDTVENTEEDKANADHFVQPSRLCVPFPLGLEKEGVQPILGAILSRLMQVVGTERVKAGSPSRIQLQRERSVDPLPGPGKSKWFADFALSKDTKPPPNSFLDLLLEVKPLGRNGTSLNKIVDGAMDQVLGHLGKRLSLAFDFGVVGVDSTATGAVLTLAHIEIVQLCLIGMGSADTKIELKSTGKLPLFSRKAVERLVDNTQKETNSFLTELFKDPASSSTISAGMDTLFRILLCKTDDLFMPYWRTGVIYRDDAAGSFECTLDERLGAGAFGTAFSIKGVTKGESSMVVKASNGSHAGTTIENEIEVLGALQNASKKDNIQQFLNKGFLHINIRGSHSVLPALRTSPKGMPIECLYELADCSTQLLVVARGVESALEFAHKKSWIHLDVRPSNIVLVMKDASKVERAILIDWGISRQAKPVVGFRGSFLYAHDDLVREKRTTTKWTPSPKHDWASLVYSLVVMNEKGRVPWSPYISDACYVKKRNSMAESHQSVDLKASCPDLFNRLEN